MEKQKTDETHIPRINSEASHMSADHSTADHSTADHSTADHSTAGSTLGDNQSNKRDDYDLEKQLEKEEEENKKLCIEKTTLQRVSQFYNQLHPDGVSVVDAMDFLDEHLDCYGNDKYKMFVES